MPNEVLVDAGTPFLAEKVSRIHVGTTITGTLTSADNIYFNGKLVGNVKLENKLVLGEKTEIIGDIFAVDLICLGRVEGQVQVRGKATFGRSSYFKGKISASLLEVENGAFFNAECFMGPFDDSSQTPLVKPAPEKIVVEEFAVTPEEVYVPQVTADLEKEEQTEIAENAFLNGIFRHDN